MAKNSFNVSRRDFLKMAGFTFAFSTGWGGARELLAKGNEAIPYLNQPEDIVAGQPYFYRSTCGGCTAGCGLSVKARDGRPIKLEGNPDHPLSKGGLCSVGQASVLGPYDSKRLTGPTLAGKETSWEVIDQEVTGKLEALRNSGGAVRFLTGSLLSPTARATVSQWLKTFADARMVVFDPLSCSAILDAHEMTFGVRVLPHYRFDRAEVLYGFDADFLGTWISPVEFTRGYQQARDPDALPARFSFHAQFEPRLTITGSKADRRYRLDPRETGLLLSQIAARLAKLSGASIDTAGLETSPAFVEEMVNRLWAARGKSLVVCGSQDVKAQILVNFINSTLDNYGATLDLENPSFQKQGNDGAVQDLVTEMEQGKVAALFINGLNPVYELPAGAAFGSALAKIPLSVSFSGAPDETTDKVKIVCPDHHYLESWMDAQPANGFVSLFQPAMKPLANTRALVESLSTWMGAPRPAYDLVREFWERELFPKQSSFHDFTTFWDQALNDGGMKFALPPVPVKSFDDSPVQALKRVEAAKGFTLLLYPKVSQLQGHHAHNPWLQELPDPITKNTWDNYACLSPAAATKLGVSTGDVVSISNPGQEPEPGSRSNNIELPVQVQSGQHESVVAIALGYGRQGTDRFRDIGPQWLDGLPSVGDNNLVGKSVGRFLGFEDRTLRYSRHGVTVTPTGKKQPIACTQRHHTITVPKNLQFPGLERRENIQEVSLAVAAGQAARLAATLTAFPTVALAAASGAALIASPTAALTAAAGVALIASVTHPPEKADLWPLDHPTTNYRWTMVIDLNRCTGCSACVIACQVENNIPVVGKDEVLREREMHWMRIDRYYSGDGEEADVAFQPMLCHHCGNAPCEVVCPVLATVHSQEGLNQQIYNRCVGTRYCANNCPYKVRRFNWFNYNREDRKQNLVLNPDITVRSRGVMEKCSFCVQRIQEARIAAKAKGITIPEGAVKTACQQSCPANAIYFGDGTPGTPPTGPAGEGTGGLQPTRNTSRGARPGGGSASPGTPDSQGRMAVILANPRIFQVLGELNVKPSVNYLKIVRNRPPSEVVSNG